MTKSNYSTELNTNIETKIQSTKHPDTMYIIDNLWDINDAMSNTPQCRNEIDMFDILLKPKYIGLKGSLLYYIISSYVYS